MKVSVDYKTNFKSGFKELKAFKQYIEKLGEEFTEVGYSDSELHRNNQTGDYDLSMSHLAYLLHEGYPEGGIPPRPFLRNTLQQLSGANEALKQPFKDYLKAHGNKQYSVDQLLLDIGEIIREVAKKNFGIDAVQTHKDNAPSTIRIKGKNDPLVDSGSLRDSMKVKTSRGGDN